MDVTKSLERSISLDDELTCSICLEIFSDPVSLPCLHSFCNDCIRGIPTHRDYRTNNLAVICPQCRTQAVLQNGTYDSLPKNFDLANIIAKFKQHQEQAHQERIQRQSSSCSIHRKEFGLYCMTCYTALCTDCFTEHKSHEVENLGEAQDKCLADLTNMMLPQLTELCTAVDGKCKKWEEAYREITNSVDNQCAEVARKFATLREKLVCKETEIIAEIQDKHRENISNYQKELMTTRTQLEKTQGFLTEAKILKLADPHTTLQCYGDFAKRVQIDLIQDIESAGLVQPLAIKPYTDELEPLIQKIETVLRSFCLKSAFQQLRIDKTEEAKVDVLESPHHSHWFPPHHRTPHHQEHFQPPPPPPHHQEHFPPPPPSLHHQEHFPPPPPPHHQEHFPPPPPSLHHQEHFPPPPPSLHHQEHFPPPPPSLHHQEHFPPPPPPHHQEHFQPPPPQPRHRGACNRKWAWEVRRK